MLVVVADLLFVGICIVGVSFKNGSRLPFLNGLN